jgi:integrase
MPSVKIYGPYQRGDGWRCYLRTDKGTARVWCPTGSTAQEARELAEVELDDWRRKVERTVEDLCSAYIEWMRTEGRQDSTVIAAQGKLQLLLGSARDVAVSAVTERWAKARYAALASSGKSAPGSHHNALKRAATCWRWAQEEGLVSANPWEKVRPIGRPTKGKEQLTIDEGRRLMAACLERANKDDAALAILIAQLCALRSMEILSRVVRDVDDGGTKLRVTSSKTDAGVRPVDIPVEIQGFIKMRTVGRHPQELLIADAGRLSQRQSWLRRNLAMYCELAGVPVVVPHALRGQWATIAYQAGALSHLVAKALGHTSSAVTEAHYAKPEAVAGAKQAERLKHLRDD